MLGTCGVATLALGSGSIALIFLGALGYGFFHGTVNVMLPVFTKRSFGEKDYARIYSRISMAACAASVATGLICGTIIHLTNDFAIVFFGISIMMALSMILVIRLKKYSVLRNMKSV